jgi:tetratricopeptide (TPR) repeat protein
MLTPLEQVVECYKNGDTDKAIQLLADILTQNPRDDNAWLWLSRCVTEPEQKKDCFEQILKINPYDQDAIEGLRLLDDLLPPKGQSILVMVWQAFRKKWPWILGAIILSGLALSILFRISPR